VHAEHPDHAIGGGVASVLSRM